MLPTRSWQSVSCRCSSRVHHLQWRRGVSQLGQDVLQTENALAKKLQATGLWNYGRWAAKNSKKQRKIKGDKSRVNIVGEKLCDDVLEYIKPSLQRHIGCDIIDLYPGAGLWSRKIHNALRPRSHIFLEPDEQLYRPFLQDLLEKDNVKLVPKSGILWRDLNSVLNPEFLPHQVEQPRNISEPPPRNDTLLVIANLAFHPRRKFNTFDSLAQLLLFQFISSIRAGSLFNKYGLVRMLVWVESSDRHGLLARCCQRRRRLAIDGEMTTEYIHEIAGSGDDSRWFVRDHGLDLESSRLALARMKSAGITIPPNRESTIVEEARTNKVKDESVGYATFSRPWRKELEVLTERFEAGKFRLGSDEYKKFKQLGYRANRESKVSDTARSIFDEQQQLAQAYESGTANPADLKEREENWNKQIGAMPIKYQNEMLLLRDNRHIFYQDPPILAWDRRAQEPLLIQNTEFFPNAPCSLLDIQPKAMHPLLRALGPGTTRSGDMFELILRGMMSSGADPVSKSIETVWPGAAEGVLPHCPSLRKLSQGGTPVGGFGELSPRVLNEVQWMEILNAWMKWPFRPSLSQLVARIADEGQSTPTSDDDLGGFE